MAESGKLKKAAAGVALTTAAGLVAVRSIFHKIFVRREKEETSIRLHYADIGGLVRKKVKIVSGAAHLTGYLYGEKSQKGLVVICHGIGSCGEDNLCMAKYMLDAGYQVFTFDYTGVCESGGKSSIGLYQSVKDLDAVLRYIESSPLKELPVFIYGHSWGGYTAAAALKFNHNIAGVVSVSGFSSPMEVVKEISKKLMPSLLAELLMPFAALYQRMLLGKNYNLSVVDAINSSSVPVLVMHGKDDEVIGYDKASIIAKREQITNPNVEYYTEQRPKKSTHMGIFFTKDAAQYYVEKSDELKLLRDIYCNRVPEKVMKKWAGKLDKNQANDMDSIFVETVLDFMDKNCEVKNLK